MAPADPEFELTASKRTLYFFSFILLVSTAFLSPDKLLLAFTPMQAGIGVPEETKGILKKFRLAS